MNFFDRLLTGLETTFRKRKYLLFLLGFIVISVCVFFAFGLQPACIVLAILVGIMLIVYAMMLAEGY